VCDGHRRVCTDIECVSQIAPSVVWSENYDLNVFPRFIESRPGLDFDLESRKRNIGHMT
jgi:hypothetical protein